MRGRNDSETFPGTVDLPTRQLFAHYARDGTRYLKGFRLELSERRQLLDRQTRFHLAGRTPTWAIDVLIDFPLD